MMRKKDGFGGSGTERLPDYSRYRLSRREWLLYGGQGVAGSAAVSYIFYRSRLAFLLLLPLGLLWPLWMRRSLARKRLRQLSLQFKEGILVLSSYLSAGYSLENALEKSTGELGLLYGKRAMIVTEFGFLTAGVRMNRPAELLLAEFGRRSGLADIDHFAQVFAAAKRSGGELVSIIGHTAGVIREKIQVQEEIHTMVAARMFEQKVMNAVPFLIVLYIDFTSPGYFEGMYTMAAGRAVMTLCLGVYAAAVVLAGRILRIEV